MEKEELWIKHYKEAKKYYIKHGTLYISGNQLKYKALNNWLKQQRIKYRKKALLVEQAILLEQIGMEWEPKLTWFHYFQLCSIYYYDYHNLMIPQEYQMSQVYIGRWLAHQRLLYRNNKLSKEKIELLESIGIVWDINNRFTWEEYYEFAKEYYKAYGHLRIPSQYQVGDMKLGHWLHNQRMSYRGKNGVNLTEEQIMLLEQIGVEWESYKTKSLKLAQGYKKLINNYEKKKIKSDD